MNVERFLALHNEILYYGWVGSGRSLGSLESTCKSWFETFGEEAEAVRSNLTPDLIRFLEHARFVNDPESELKDTFFFYWVQNLASPDFMFEQEDCWPDEGRYLVLYAMSNFTGHFCGLVYDQQTDLCIISPTIHDTDEIIEQKVWYPLETVLEFWLGQTRQGRIAALPEEKNRNYDLECFSPWEFVPYNDIMVEENIGAFNRLVEAIEARMPPTVSTTEAEEVIQGLVGESALQTMPLSQRFAYDFLRRARRPRFQMIAPGLEVLTTSMSPDQPFHSYMSDSDPDIPPPPPPPLLLFRSKSKFTDETIPNIVTGEPIPKLFSWYSHIKTYPAGLYLPPTSPVRAEDECMLILPFGIGENGHARKTDGSRFGMEGHGEKSSHIDLYRPGYQPFEQPHEQSLVDVLESWRGMVERGDWQIDENGVAGNMDVWREADTEEKWEKYVIPRAVERVER